MALTMSPSLDLSAAMASARDAPACKDGSAEGKSHHGNDDNDDKTRRCCWCWCWNWRWCC
jgi:hypothetical protein